MTNLGIMQGRLLPPIDNRIQCFPAHKWQEEFPRAAQAGLQCIEWIYEIYGAEVNPLMTDEGCAEIIAATKQFGVCVRSICADYFMEKPLLRVDCDELKYRITTLCRLMCQGAKLGVNRIVVPFVDASRIETEADRTDVIWALSCALDMAEETSVELHLETSLPPQEFADLLRRLPHSQVKVNYDTGNSASLGYRPAEEFGAYGNRVGSVHIKDRIRNGGTVPLGTGDTDFPEVFSNLEKIRYNGDFILQAARGESGEEVALACVNRAFFEGYCSFLTENASR